MELIATAREAKSKAEVRKRLDIYMDEVTLDRITCGEDIHNGSLLDFLHLPLKPPILATVRDRILD